MTTLPPEITVETLEDGYRYTLPTRDLGKWRYVGLAPLLFGLGFMGFAVFWGVMASGIWEGLGKGFQFDAIHGFRLLFACFCLPFIFVGFKVVRIGLLLLRPNHEVITLRKGWLKVDQVGGWLHYGVRIKAEDIARIEIAPANLQGDEIPGLGMAGLAGMRHVRIIGNKGKAFSLGMGYPKAWGLLLAEDITHRLQLAQTHPILMTPLEPGTGPAQPIPIVPADPNSMDDEGKRIYRPASGHLAQLDLPQPANSAITYVPNGDVHTYIIPARGFKGVGLGFFIFAVIWSAFSGGMFVLALRDFSPGALFVLLFVAVGVAMLGVALHLMTRKTVIVITPDEFVATTSSRIRKQEIVCARNDITEIIVDYSGVEVNDKPVEHIKVKTNNNQTHGLLMGNDVSELHWLANSWRKIMGLTTADDLPGDVPAA